MLLLFIICMLGYIMLFESSFIYFPSKYPAGNWEVNRFRAAEGESITRVEDVWMEAEDGVRLHGWFCTPHRWQDGEARPVESSRVILWCHGNAGNITHRYDKISHLTQAPSALFIFDYRGYGRSEGSPSEAGVYLDAMAAWRHLTEERGYAPRQIVIYGVSMGGAVAIELATKVEPAGLIIESSFTSIADMAAATMPFIPRCIIRTRMNSLDKIGAITVPKLVVHGDADEIIPYRMGEALYEAAAPPKRFHAVADATHNETDLIGGEAYYTVIRDFVLEVTSSEPEDD